MVTTITPSTVSIQALSALSGSLALIGIIVLLVLLIQKELASASNGQPYRKMSAILNIGIIPLLIVFALIVVSRVLEVLK
jgi:hypothetical protein